MIESRALLEERVGELEQRYGQGELPLPTGWGGYRLVPETIELWQQRHDRLHDRLRYRRATMRLGDRASRAVARSTRRRELGLARSVTD